jgi:hypothetical protein
MDVGDWLRDLGLGQYEAAFDENSVSMELLPHLRADDLKDLGVNAIGHRRLLSNAIEALRVAQSALALKIRGKVERSRGRTAALET